MGPYGLSDQLEEKGFKESFQEEEDYPGGSRELSRKKQTQESDNQYSFDRTWPQFALFW